MVSQTLHEPDEQKTRGSSAYETIRQRIVSLDIRPGTMVSETQLADELKVSKTPIREALGRLQSERLVDVVGRTGYRVKPITLKDARDLFAVRVVLEAEAAAEAAEQVAAGVLGDEQIAQLFELASYSADLTAPGAIETHVARNAEFHTGLARVAGNDVLADLLEIVLTKSQRLHRLYLELVVPAHIREHEHEETVRAVATGNLEEARQVTIQILEADHADIIDTLLSSPVLLNANIGL